MTFQQPLPPVYKSLSDQELTQKIIATKEQLSNKIVILGHHYQRPEIVRLADVRGDSLKLAQYAAAQERAEVIVYCGVHFMAESADILQKGDQKIVLPDLGAGCDMADMADASDVEIAWEALTASLGNDDVMPVTYINSTAALKAFVGKKGGVVCTSTNAAAVIGWALKQRRRVFFFPDQHLGRNTCKRMGISLDAMALWNPAQPLGGLSDAAIAASQVLLWQGHCPVHQMLAAKQIDALLAQDPSFQIIVHPECSLEVVDKAPFVGSTEYIVDTIAKSAPGTKWAVGTEMNLVNRIAQENPDKTVVSINRFMCLCGTMNRIDLAHLAWVLDAVSQNDWKTLKDNVITVAEPERAFAFQALERMLQLSF